MRRAMPFLVLQTTAVLVAGPATIVFAHDTYTTAEIDPMLVWLALGASAVSLVFGRLAVRASRFT